MPAQGQANIPIADKAFDAVKRALERQAAAAKSSHANTS